MSGGSHFDVVQWIYWLYISLPVVLSEVFIFSKIIPKEGWNVMTAEKIQWYLIIQIILMTFLNIIDNGIIILKYAVDILEWYLLY